MDLRECILLEELIFPKYFTSYVEKEYGILFYNKYAKESNDSNHAVLYPNKVQDFSNILKEIKTFYLSKEITPIIYQPFINGYFGSKREEFENQGYKIEYYGHHPIMVLTDENTLHTPKRLNIRQLFEWDTRIARDIFIPLGKEYEIEVIKNSLVNKNNHLFVGYLEDVAVTITYAHVSQYNCTRFDHIVTTDEYRQKGYARELLSFVVEYCKENELPTCYQWPAHSTSEKMCYEAGFRELFQIEECCATYIVT